MSFGIDLATVDRLLVSEYSIPLQLRMHEDLDEGAYSELTDVFDRLTDHYANRTDMPKCLARPFVDIGTAFYFQAGAYPGDELERIEDVGKESSQMGQRLYRDKD
ncbi:hypothetical protein [Demequina aurantiaca]|uniref:hypothetical protein n=1 Tax=Demequina aurantiaca TaxID=676200 RepID=UPI000784702E|nr:hypothetical protein [Demequina aurantiaca]